MDWRIWRCWMYLTVSRNESRGDVFQSKKLNVYIKGVKGEVPRYLAGILKGINPCAFWCMCTFDEYLKYSYLYLSSNYVLYRLCRGVTCNEVKCLVILNREHICRPSLLYAASFLLISHWRISYDQPLAISTIHSFSLFTKSHTFEQSVEFEVLLTRYINYFLGFSSSLESLLSSSALSSLDTLKFHGCQSVILLSLWRAC